MFTKTIDHKCKEDHFQKSVSCETISNQNYFKNSEIVAVFSSGYYISRLPWGRIWLNSCLCYSTLFKRLFSYLFYLCKKINMFATSCSKKRSHFFLHGCFRNIKLLATISYQPDVLKMYAKMTNKKKKKPWKDVRYNHRRVKKAALSSA